MKKMMLLFAFALTVIVANAQVGLTEAEKEILKNRIIEKLDDWQNELKIIGNRNNSVSTIDYAIKEAKLLFMGDSDYVATESNNYWGRAGYYHSRENGRDITERVDMQTSSKNNSYKPVQLMAKYLVAIKNMANFRYDKIVIERAGAVRVDNINKLPNGNYIAIAHILQKFEGYKDGYKLYDDYTKKEVVIYIRFEEIITPDGKVKNWIILLEDMLVEETW